MAPETGGPPAVLDGVPDDGVGRGHVRWRDRIWARWGLVALVGGAMFSLGVTYLSLAAPPSMASFLVLGGTGLRPGSPLGLRLSAHDAVARRAVAVRVGGARVDGVPVEVGAQGRSPAYVHLVVPSGLTSREAEVELDVEAGERRETVRFRAPVETIELSGGAPAKVSGAGHAGEIPREALDVRLVVEDGALTAGMDNRVFLRLRDAQGRAVAGADARVEHKAIPTGRARGRTDGAGLFAFTLRADQPSLNLRVDVRTDDGRQAHVERLLRPYGQQMILRSSGLTVRPGEPIEATLQSWPERLEATCDLYAGDVLLWTAPVETVKHRATLRLDPLPAGVYQLQCYRHPTGPGDTAATLAIVVTPREPLAALLGEAAGRGYVDRERFYAEGAQAHEAPLAGPFLLALLSEPPIAPKVLVATRVRDLEARKAERRASKTRVLAAMAGVFLLVLLWVVDVLLRHTLRTRRRLRAFALEAAAEGAVDDVDDGGPLDMAALQAEERLERTRGVVLAVLMVGALVANLVGVLWLFATIR